MPRDARRALLIIAAALCVPLLPFAVVGELPGEQWLSARDDNAWRFALAGAGLLAGDVLLPIPSSVVGSMLGARLGFGAGFAAAFAGLMAGQVAAYVVARRVMRKQAGALPAAPTLALLVLSRPVPVLAEAVAVAAGAARMHRGQFVLACGAGNIAYAGALAYNGAALLAEAPIGPGWLLPLLLPVAGWLAWRARRRRDHQGG